MTLSAEKDEDIPNTSVEEVEGRPHADRDRSPTPDKTPTPRIDNVTQFQFGDDRVNHKLVGVLPFDPMGFPPADELLTGIFYIPHIKQYTVNVQFLSSSDRSRK